MSTVGTEYIDDLTLGTSIPRKNKQNKRSLNKSIKRMSNYMNINCSYQVVDLTYVSTSG